MSDTMNDNKVFRIPETVPSPGDLASAWTKVVENAVAAMASGARPPSTIAHDPTAPARALAEFTAMRSH